MFLRVAFLFLFGVLLAGCSSNDVPPVPDAPAIPPGRGSTGGSGIPPSGENPTPPQAPRR